MPKFDRAKAEISLVETTGDPLAPVKIQEAHKYAAAVGKMLVPVSNKEQVAAIQQRLLSDFEDAELNDLCKTPAFIMALCSMLTNALVSYTITHQ